MTRLAKRMHGEWPIPLASTEDDLMTGLSLIRYGSCDVGQKTLPTLQQYEQLAAKLPAASHSASAAHTPQRQE